MSLHILFSLIVLSILSQLIVVDGAKVLCYFPNPSKSHVLLALPICEELASRGHRVVAVTNQKYGKTSKNYTEVVIPSNGYSLELSQALTSGKKPDSPLFYLKVCEDFASENIVTLTSPQFQKILQEESFDLIFFISVFANHVQLGIADHFKAPYIALSPLGSVYYTRDMVGAPSFPAAVPAKFSEFPKEMTFIQRASNLFTTFMEIQMSTYLDFIQSRQYSKYWPKSTRTYSEMKRNISVIYYNQYAAQSKIAQPLLPTEVEVGGIQVSSKSKPLSQELKTWIDEAKHGVILWTFGTNIPMITVRPEKLEIILKVLSKLKQRVIMKWESTDSSKIPSNFLTKEWLPQDSILAHPNVKLFINHGGAGGCNEALFHRVPMFGIPFFGDQPSNVQKHVADGWARGMTLDQITEELFSEAVNDLLTNQT